MLTGGVMIVLPLRRGTGQPERHRGVSAAAILGLAMAVWLGAVLQAKPDSYAVASPNPATWAPEYNTVPDNIGFDCILVPDFPWRAPKARPRRATCRPGLMLTPPFRCATHGSLRVCVYRDYGPVAAVNVR